MQKKIVVSLCGGTDSAYLSCLDAGIDVSPDGQYEYHTFETDKYASAVSRYRIPHAIHHGDALHRLSNVYNLTGRTIGNYLPITYNDDRLIHNANNIFVLKNGNIINKGTHESLISNCKEYKSLYEKQLKSYF